MIFGKRCLPLPQLLLKLHDPLVLVALAPLLESHSLFWPSALIFCFNIKRGINQGELFFQKGQSWVQVHES